MIDVNQDFTREVECEYKGEHYKVRDNGAIFRMVRDGKPKRAKDEVWTFGDIIDRGYAKFCGESVHRIVAFAFIGEPPSKQYVVDHIDTNRQNNRPENLRWLTKLENVLLNSYTKAKIEYLCGSIENFLKNPSLLSGHENDDSNFSWMRAVTREEAENTLHNWDKLVNTPRDYNRRATNQISEWIFHKNNNNVSVNHTLFEEQAILKPKPYSREIEGRPFSLVVNRSTKEIKTVEVPVPITKSEFMTAMQDICMEKGLSYDMYYKTDKWKADYLITVADRQLAFNVYKSNKAAEKDFGLMRQNDVIGYGVKLSPKNNTTDATPCFGLHRRNNELQVTISNKNLSLSEFINKAITGKLIYNTQTLVTHLDVMFIPTECYFCGKPYYIYSVYSMVDANGNRISHDKRIDFELEGLIPDLVFGKEVQSAVRRFIVDHPEKNIMLGTIKERFSRTRNEGYMSFGCPECDGILGEYYLTEYQNEAIYENDPKKINRLKLEAPFEVPIGCWEVK